MKLLFCLLVPLILCGCGSLPRTRSVYIQSHPEYSDRTNLTLHQREAVGPAHTPPQVTNDPYGGLAIVYGRPAPKVITSGEIRKDVATQIEQLALQEGSLEIFSLHWSFPNEPKTSHLFHHYEVLGSAKVDSAEDRQALLSALATSIRENQGSVANCFNPRHGLRFIKDGKLIDLVICFECLSARCYGINNDQSVWITPTGKAAFDAFLTKKNVKLSD